MATANICETVTRQQDDLQRVNHGIKRLREDDVEEMIAPPSKLRSVSSNRVPTAQEGQRRKRRRVRRPQNPIRRLQRKRKLAEEAEVSPSKRLRFDNTKTLLDQAPNGLLAWQPSAKDSDVLEVVEIECRVCSSGLPILPGSLLPDVTILPGQTYVLEGHFTESETEDSEETSDDEVPNHDEEDQEASPPQVLWDDMADDQQNWTIERLLATYDPQMESGKFEIVQDDDEFDGFNVFPLNNEEDGMDVDVDPPQAPPPAPVVPRELVPEPRTHQEELELLNDLKSYIADLEAQGIFNPQWPYQFPVPEFLLAPTNPLINYDVMWHAPFSIDNIPREEVPIPPIIGTPDPVEPETPLLNVPTPPIVGTQYPVENEEAEQEVGGGGKKRKREGEDEDEVEEKRKKKRKNE
jgi:hypothetical protein